MNEIIIEPSPLIYIERVKEWMTARGKSIDIGRTVQIVMLIITIATIIFEAGRIIDRQDAKGDAILVTIKSNEDKRDLKDQTRILEVGEIKGMLDEEKKSRKDLEERFNKLRDLYLVNFGSDPEKKFSKP